MDSMVSQMGNMMQGMSSAQGSARANTQNTAQLVSQLTQLLNVNPKQAVGGTAALMALASSKMPKKNYNSLINSVPGLSSIAGGASPLSIFQEWWEETGKKIHTAFKALGMDSSMSSKFAPALLEILNSIPQPEYQSAI